MPNLCTWTSGAWLRLACCLQIGTVFASESYVCPNAVGVDIGEATSDHGPVASVPCCTLMLWCACLLVQARLALQQIMVQSNCGCPRSLPMNELQ